MFKVLFVSFSLSLVGLSAEAQDSLNELSPETRAIIATQITVAQKNEAISSFVREGSEGETVLRLARAGDRDAARVIGRQCLRDGVCPAPRKESHDLLVAAAGTDYSSAKTLATIYRDGLWGGKKYPVSAAQWLGHAHKLGSSSAIYMLEDLPIEAVREAGVEHLLPQTTAKRVIPKPQAAETKSKPDEEDGLYTMEADEAEALADLLFGTGSAVPSSGPTVLDWPGKAQGFPVFADTKLNASGDAAASCYVVARAELEGLMDQIDAGTAPTGSVGTLQGDSLRMQLYFDMLDNPKISGVSDKVTLAIAVEDHDLARQATPERGPSKAFCKENFLAFSTDVSIAKAGTE